MDRQNSKITNDGEKSGGGKAYPMTAATPYRVITYEKIVLAKMLSIIFLGLLSLLYFGAQQ